MASRDYKKVFETIDRYQFVSLDIFDTLVFRLTHYPTDVFSMMEIAAQKRHGLEIKNFAKHRICAEQAARELACKRSVGEINLVEIYEELQAQLDLDADTVGLLIELETELELSFIQLTDFGGKLINYLAEHPSKRVVLTSDMYLNRAFIDKVLNKAGISFHEQLFLSSEVRRTKHEGALYSDVVSYFACQPKEILHIGDNFEADTVRSNAFGLHGMHLEASRSVFMDQKVWAESSLFATKFGPKILFNSMFAEKLGSHAFNTWHGRLERDKQDYIEGLGSLVLAPLLLALCIWIKEALEANGIKKVCFLARDGQIVFRVFRLLYVSKF